MRERVGSCRVGKKPAKLRSGQGKQQCGYFRAPGTTRPHESICTLLVGSHMGMSLMRRQHICLPAREKNVNWILTSPFPPSSATNWASHHSTQAVMMLPLALASLARQQLNWHTARLLHHTSSRSFRSFCFAPAKHVLLQSSGNCTARSTLKSPLYFAPTVHYRILALFATKSSATPTTTEQSPPSRPKSVWKSSAKALEAEVEDGASAYREKLYRQLNHEKDLSGVVKEETVLYTLTGTTLYRVFFVLIIAQFFFWVICANILYMFYAGIDSDGNKLRDLYKGEKEDKGKEASFLQTCWDNFSGKTVPSLGLHLSLTTPFLPLQASGARCCFRDSSSPLAPSVRLSLCTSCLAVSASFT